MRRLFLLLSLGCFVVPNGVAAERPNIVYIMADELGYDELSCLAHPNIQTPRIDLMVREEIRFTLAIAGSSV